MNGSSVLLMLILVGCAKHHAISGLVLDRNGKPLGRTNVTLAPGNVEIITDDNGRFMIDYLRDAEGTRVKMGKRTDYAIEYFKVGYHPQKSTFYFKNGELTLEPASLAEDTVRVEASDTVFDPGAHPNRGQEAGGSYEGE
ncbi:MAG: carboxypeptidase regulatory-like domain-containing protein [Myxococcales bacterium]|nr:carboxypeptidase regulatory-like domain-containing protein [Myxococcales bacterium]